jgi:peptidoglycan DL-endopeptidase RipA
MSNTRGRHSARHRVVLPEEGKTGGSERGLFGSVRRRQIAATASAAALGLAMSTLLAMPANAEPISIPVSSYGTVVDSHGRTAAQILNVSADVQSPTIQDSNETAVELAGIVAEENHDYSGASVPTVAAAIAAALAEGGPRSVIIQDALTYLGDPYVEGGASHSGIDCSGLVMVAYAQVGIQLVHLVSAQDDVATTIPESAALPGDLVVYNDHAHIGIYLGDGLLIQAPHPGEPVDIIPIFAAAHHFARILPANN